MPPEQSGAEYWEQRAKSLPQMLPRTAEAVGARCATDYCGVTNGISYDKPLCYKHWKEFDAYRIFECERCHWFDELVGEFTDETFCPECVQRERRGNPPTPVYAHAPVERRIRYLYILKLDGGQYYCGQTNDLVIRLREHQDGTTPSTRGKQPRLVWFEEWKGLTRELNQAEDDLTLMADNNPRVIRRMVEEWQKPFRLVDLT